MLGAPALLRQRVEDRGRGGARERVAAERAAEAAGRNGVHQLFTAGDGRERQSAAERLARDEQVGLDAVVLDRPDRAGAAAAALHLVVDVEDPVAVEQLLQSLREVGCHRDEAALALHRLQHRAGNRLRVDVALEETLQRRDRVVLAHAAERVRRGRPVHLGRERAEALLVRDDLGGHRHREQRSAVECVVEDDDCRAPGRDARDLDRVLDRLRAGAQEQRLLVRRLGTAKARPASGTPRYKARTSRP